MNSVKLLALLYVATIIFLIKTDACLISRKHEQYDFLVRWRIIDKTLYQGKSLKELIDMCPNGCDAANCSTFPVYSSRNPSTGQISAPAHKPCNDHDIKALRQAQKIAKGWGEALNIASRELIIHSITVLLIALLIILLIVRKHYRFTNLFFLPSHRQWELERDPTWGLPGKVWGLVQMKVVKSDNQEPTDRKYEYYTDNPTAQGEEFWYYKQVLRDMYKTHKYYKRNRYFHKLSWQVNNLGKVIPETLRRHKANRRRAGELEEQRSNASSADVDPQENLPWEIDLPDEINITALKKAKVRLQAEVNKAELAGHMVNGRNVPPQHHHHHHHAPPGSPPPQLTAQEVENAAKEMVVDPHADFVNVDGIMMLDPAAVNKPGIIRVHHRHHRHSHHQAHSHSQPKARPSQKPRTK